MKQLEFQDLIDYATKKYDVEDEIALSWCEWLLGDDASLDFVLSMLTGLTPNALGCSENHPIWLGHIAVRDYMTELELDSVSLVR